MKFLLNIILVSVLLIGCSSAPVIKERIVPVPVKIHPVEEVIEMRDTTNEAGDSLLYGSLVDSLNKVIAEITIDLKRKVAELKIPERIDTIYVAVKDTLPGNAAAGIGNEIIPAVVSVLSWWEQSILYGGIGLIIALLIGLRVKRGKVF